MVRRLPLALVVVAVLGSACGTARDAGMTRAGDPGTGSATIVLPPTTPDAEGRILHVLNRLAYGPRPGDVERVRAIGVAAWIERQLHPEQIPDEMIERRLAAYPTTRMTTDELFREYPRPDPAAVARRQEEMAGGGTMTSPGPGRPAGPGGS